MKRRIGIFLLIISTLSSNVFGLSLIDKMDYIDEKFKISPPTETDQVQELKSTSDYIINVTLPKSWNNYTLKDGYKYLINKNMLHEFNRDNDYQKTIKQSINSDDNKESRHTYESRYLEVLKTEKDRYIRSGFEDMPSLHISTIRDDNSYFNQLENKIKPGISCVPTAVTMFLHIQDIKELIPDDISQGTYFSSNGSTIDDVLSSLRYAYGVPYRSYDWGFNLNTIQESIHENIPVISYIKGGYIDYYYVFDNETYQDRRNRLYHVKNSANATYSHAILITGYLEIAGVTYLEIYDPWSTNNVWADGKPIPNGKGKFMTYDAFKKINNGPVVRFDIGTYKLKDAN